MPKMKKLQIVKTRSEDGEVHFILMEIAVDNSFEKRRSVDEAEVREIMKKQAARPLLLLREE